MSAEFDFKAYLGKAKERVEAALDGSLGPERPESLRTKRSIEGRFHPLFGLAEIGLEIELGAHGWTLAGGILSGRALSCCLLYTSPSPRD